MIIELAIIQIQISDEMG